MAFDNLKVALRRSVLRGPLGVALLRDGANLTALADVSDVPSLLARLDETPLYEPQRDALLADLLRLHRSSRDGAALDALVYATHANVLGRCLDLAGACEDPHEWRARVLALLIKHLEACDPDRRRSPHIQAGLELRVRRDLVRALASEARQGAARLEVAAAVRHAANDLIMGTLTFRELLEECGSAAPANDTERLAASVVTALLQGLVEHRILGERDAQLFGRVDLLGQTIADVARELGMRLGAARKAIQRARRSLQKRPRLVETILLSHLPKRVAF